MKADARGEASVDDADDRGVVDLTGESVRIAKEDSRETPADPMDLERDPAKDDVTGAEMIRGGR